MKLMLLVSSGLSAHIMLKCAESSILLNGNYRDFLFGGGNFVFS